MLAGELLAVDAQRVERRDVADLHALDERRGEHAARRQLARSTRGKTTVGSLREVRRDALDVLRLALEVELLGDHLRIWW